MPSSGNGDAEAGSPVHLVVMCHGLWGEPRHLLALETILSKSLGTRARVVGANADTDEDSSAETTLANATKRDDAAMPRITKQEAEYLVPFITSREDEADMDVVILNTSSNAGGKTYDGIDWWGDRVVKEIRAEQTRITTKRRQQIVRFSMIGYSMGGLVARYVIGVLESDGFFAGTNAVQARQLITLATPHLGAPPGSGSFPRLIGYVGARLLSRTGEQVFIKDSGWEGDAEADDDPEEGQRGKDSRRVGLLEYMAQPSSVFMRGLRRFERVRFYANAVNDPTVPFRTGCVEEWDPFLEGLRVDVTMHSGMPIISSLSTQDPLPLTLSQSVYCAVPSLPPFLNPRRLPFRFPYNYLIVGFAPIMLPLFLSMVVWRLSKDDRKSRLRIKDLERGLDPELRGANRISALMNSVLQSAGEERVDASSLDPEGSTHGEARSRAGSVGEEIVHRSHVSVTVDEDRDAQSNKKAPRSVWSAKSSARPSRKPKQPPLLAAQANIARHLNDATVLPRLVKLWAYFPEVINGHAMIVCRMPTMEVQRRGLPILQHLVDNLLL